MSTLRLLLAHLKLEWDHFRRDRSALMWTLIMPFLFMLFFGSVFREDTAPRENRTLALAVQDDDRTHASAAIAALLDSTRFALAAADTGAPLRTLVLPRGLQDSVFAAHPIRVRLVHHRDDEELAFAADAGVVRALVRFHGALALASPDSGGWTDSTLARFDAARSAPSRVGVDSRWGGRGFAPAGFRQSVPGNLVVFVMMSTVIGAATLLVTERSSGALRRAAAGPLPSFLLVLLRVVPRFAVAGAQALLLLGGAHVFFGYRIAGSPAAFVAVAFAFAFVCVGIGLGIGARFKTVGAAAMAAWITSMLMSSIGGAWWSLEFVSGAMRAVAHFLPTAWAMDGLHAVATYGGGFREAALPIAVLLGMGALVLAAATRGLRPAD
jgi:ABC-2 type transport system permease protein